MMNPEESIPKDEPMEEGGEASSSCVCVQPHGDGTYDVYPMLMHQRATEAEYPDGLFGLGSIEEALKGVIALDRQGAEYSSPGRTAMLEEYSE